MAVSRTTDRPASELMDRLVRDAARLREEIVPQARQALADAKAELLEQRRAAKEAKKALERARHKARLVLRMERNDDGSPVYAREADYAAAIYMRVDDLEDALAEAEVLVSGASKAWEVAYQQMEAAKELIKMQAATARAYNSELWVEHAATRTGP